jgi:rod shape-determining protein MreC
MGIRIMPATAKQPVANFFMKTAYAPFFAIRHWTDDIAKLRDENARLRQALAEASWRWQEREEYAREVDRLRTLLERTPDSEKRLRVARIVGWDQRGGRNAVVVDIGAADELRVFTPAITEEGVAGKVVEVMDRFSRVQLLTDPACRIAVRDTRSGVIGVVRTGRDEGLWMVHVGIESDVRQGDTLITSGVGGIFPAGLQVGVVTDVLRATDSLLLGVHVKPAVALDKLDYVFFLQSDAPLPPGAPFEPETEER